MDIGFCLFVISMIAANYIHDRVEIHSICFWFLCQKFEKIVLQGFFVLSMVTECSGEMTIVGIGKCIGSIMNQLTKRIVIVKIQFRPILQPDGNSVHEMSGITVIVPPKPLTAERPFEIGYGIVVRFNAAELKSFYISHRYVFHCSGPAEIAN